MPIRAPNIFIYHLSSIGHSFGHPNVKKERKDCYITSGILDLGPFFCFQYEKQFDSKILQNWEVPKTHREVSV